MQITKDNIGKLISIHHPLITQALQTKEEVHELKKQILENQEKAEQWTTKGETSQ